MESKRKGFIYRNSLSLVFLLLFLASLAAQSYTGWHEHNDFLGKHGRQPEVFSAYLSSGHFIQATFENWESEFFQMGLFVICTIFLKQQGSSESSSQEKKEEKKDEDVPKPESPWPVKKGG